MAVARTLTVESALAAANRATAQVEAAKRRMLTAQRNDRRSAEVGLASAIRASDAANLAYSALVDAEATAE